MVPYINYQGQKLTKSKKYISNDDFSTGIGEGTSHHSNSIITVAGINCDKTEMYKTVNGVSAIFFPSDFTDSALLPNMPTELNVKLALEHV